MKNIVTLVSGVLMGLMLTVGQAENTVTESTADLVEASEAIHADHVPVPAADPSEDATRVPNGEVESFVGADDSLIINSTASDDPAVQAAAEGSDATVVDKSEPEEVNKDLQNEGEARNEGEIQVIPEEQAQVDGPEPGESLEAHQSPAAESVFGEKQGDSEIAEMGLGHTQDLDYAAFGQSVKRLLAGEMLLPQGLVLHRPSVIADIYESAGYRPLWKPEAIASLSRALDGLILDGLESEPYRLEPIHFYLEDPMLRATDESEWALVDVSLTESFLRALYNLEFGKVDPEQLDADFNYPKARKSGPSATQLLAWIEPGAIDRAFDQARPQHDQYQQLRAALIEHYQHHDDQAWQQIPAGRILKPGMRDSRVPLLRKRLGVKPGYDQDEQQFDKELERAVRAFQEERNLDVDGVLGPMTLSALNITLDQRIDQIRVNLERHRWFDPLAEDEYLLVDVAGFRLTWLRQGEVIWQERVQVGKPATKTPIFRDEMRFLEFNPSWSIPPGINRRVTLPSLRLDPGYLNKKGYQLLTDQGKPVDPYSVDWHSVRNMPYIVRQPPGPSNALGRVKFMFPNKHHVFLHDTNHRDLFGREVRTTSSGCIRLRDPFELAERLLGHQGWDRSRIDKVVSSRSTTRVDLEQPLPIYIRYLTAEATEAGVSFRNDIYSRDAKVLAMLDGSFQVHLADMPKHQQAAVRARLRSASEARYLPAEPEVIGVPEEPVVQKVESTGTPTKWRASFIDL